MNGVLAQTAALAAHARVRRIDTRLGGDESYWAAHSTFRYVRSLSFKLRERALLRTAERAVASTPTQWMTTLPAGSVVSFVSLGASGPLEAHIASAFVGGTREGIAVHNPGREVLWIPGWEVVGQHPDTRIWAVTYVGQSLGGFTAASKTVGEAAGDLQEALSHTIEFASFDPCLSGWRDTFEKARENLRTSQPVAPYHPDILPPEGYSLAARQLLAASVAGFVFGGMGSWNDVSFADSELQARYEQITRRLYVAVVDGLVAAVNEGASL